MKNYYKVLGIPQTANSSEIKEAYKTLAAKYHPQKNEGDRYAGERFIDISVAYNTLINADKRKDYDRILNSVLTAADHRDIQKKLSTSEPLQSEPKGKTIAFTKLHRNYYYAAASTVAIAAIISAKIYLFKAGNSSATIARQEVKKPVNTAIQLNKTETPPIIGTTNEKQDLTKYAVAIEAEKTADKKEISSVETKAKTEIAANKKPIPKAASTQIASQVIEEEQPVYASIEQKGFSIGASKKEVLDKQGTPTSIVKFKNASENWYYGNSRVIFTNNQVSAYENTDNTLLIHQ